MLYLFLYVCMYVRYTATAQNTYKLNVLITILFLGKPYKFFISFHLLQERHSTGGAIIGMEKPAPGIWFRDCIQCIIQNLNFVLCLALFYDQARKREMWIGLICPPSGNKINLSSCVGHWRQEPKVCWHARFPFIYNKSRKLNNKSKKNQVS